MLTSIALRDFKSFIDERATLSSFTLLIGANGSGKSNFLDALRLVHGLSHGWPMYDVLNERTAGATSVWPGIRGGSRELVRLNSSQAEIESNWLIDSDLYRFQLSTDGSNLLRESVGNLIESNSDPISGKQVVRFLDGSGVPGTEELSAQEARSVASFDRGWLRPLRFTLGGIRFVDPVPSEMRRYAPQPSLQPVLLPSSSGSNLSAVLWQLCQRDQYRTELTDWLTEFLGPEVKDIDFDVNGNKEVQVRIVDAAGAKISAASMSDGTLRFLYLLAQLKTLWADSPLVIEDLEQGLHPQRCRLLVEAIASITTPRNLSGDGMSVIATTHSADVIEAALRIPHATVLLFARDPLSHGTVIRDVRALPQFDEVCKRRDFGYLLNTGWLERAV